MPQWEGIEDSGTKPTRIWLSRIGDDDEWQPLRKSDCRALNDSNIEENEVYIEGGRATADKASGCIRYNFFNAPCRKLCSTSWFAQKDEKNKEGLKILEPMSDADTELVESFYQSALQAGSPLGVGIQKVLDQKGLDLVDRTNYKVIVVKNTAGQLSMKLKPKAWFGTTYDLQRGYREYTVDGEEDELLLGDVKHLIFVVHGIGEAMWSRSDIVFPSLIEEMNRTRTTLQKMQIAEWRKEVEKSQKTGSPLPKVPPRVELLPIEWWDKIHHGNSEVMQSLQRSTLSTIPALRAIANDVVLDVMIYLTPNFCETVLNSVSTQIDDLFRGFQRVHPNFLQNGGKCSLVGHSLGAVIVWDLLSILKANGGESPPPSESMDAKDEDTPRPPPMNPEAKARSPGLADNFGSTSSIAFDGIQDVNDKLTEGVWGPRLPPGSPTLRHKLPFVPDFTMFLGSPIGMFLSLRGATASFDHMLDEQVAKADATMSNHSDDAEGASFDGDVGSTIAIVSPFTLPSGSVYNVFHPCDPVAYRIEPLLLSKGVPVDDIPNPQYLVKRGRKLRLHLQAKQLGDDLRKNLARQSSKWTNLISNVTEQAVSAIKHKGGGDNIAGNNDDRPPGERTPTKQPRSSDRNQPRGPPKFPLGGKSDRVDYQLQSGVIDNEYLSAVLAHSSYFSNSDLLEFVIDLVAGDEQPQVAPEDGEQQDQEIPKIIQSTSAEKM